MVTAIQILALRQRCVDVLQKYLIPLGWVILLTSMFIAGERNRVHQLFYVFLALPTLLYVILQPKITKKLACNSLFISFALFSAYMIVTVGWSATEETALSLMKRPIYIAMLFFASGIIAINSVEKFNWLTYVSAIIASLAAAASLAYFLTILIPDTGMRLNGYGALYNPLLSAHVFGAFATFWLATWLQGKRLYNPLPLACLLVLGATLIATGSRTPLVGLAAALLWLVATGNKRQGIMILTAIAAAIVGLLLTYPEVVTQRGVSYRPEIWMETLRQIGQRPWLGHGYDSEIVVKISTLEAPLADPHNMELGVLYAGGIIGFALWCLTYAIAFRFCWKYRLTPAISLAGAWLMFGLGSGLSEGMAFLSRPKEHWFLIWIPMALVYAQWIAKETKPEI